MQWTNQGLGMERQLKQFCSKTMNGSNYEEFVGYVDEMSATCLTRASFLYKGFTIRKIGDLWAGFCESHRFKVSTLKELLDTIDAV